MKSGNVRGWLHAAWRGAARLAAEAACPPLCAACLGDLDNDDPDDLLCPRCREQLPACPGSFCFACGSGHEGAERHRFQDACGRETHRNYRATALYWMSGPVPELVHQFKYRGVTGLAREWGGSVASTLGCDVRAQADWILPVPLHASRLRERGYNQSALLAREVGRIAGLPCVEDAVTRVRRTRTQTRLRSGRRLTNLLEAFAVVQPTLVRGARILLVDDVLTTGATMGALGDLLVDHGAGGIRSVVVARA